MIPKIDPSKYGKLTLPVDADKNGSADEIPASKLPLTGTYVSPYFKMENGVAVFTAPVNGGGTTTNAKYVRSELREQIVLGSDRDNWSLAGVHVQKGTVRVDQLPTPIGTNVVKTVVAQIHGVDAPPPIKLQVAKSSDGRCVVYGIYNTSPTATQSASSKKVAVAIGQTFDYEIRVENNRLVTLINNVIIDNRDMTPWAAEKFYFKAGNYVQNLPNTATGSCVVSHLALSTSHN